MCIQNAYISAKGKEKTKMTAQKAINKRSGKNFSILRQNKFWHVNKFRAPTNKRAFHYLPCIYEQTNRTYLYVTEINEVNVKHLQFRIQSQRNKYANIAVNTDIDEILW